MEHNAINGWRQPSGIWAADHLSAEWKTKRLATAETQDALLAELVSAGFGAYRYSQQRRLIETVEAAQRSSHWGNHQIPVPADADADTLSHLRALGAVFYRQSIPGAVTLFSHRQGGGAYCAALFPTAEAAAQAEALAPVSTEAPFDRAEVRSLTQRLPWE